MDVGSSCQTGTRTKAYAAQLGKCRIPGQSEIGETEASVNLVRLVHIVIDTGVKCVLLERTRPGTDIVRKQAVVGRCWKFLQNCHRLRRKLRNRNQVAGNRRGSCERGRVVYVRVVNLAAAGDIAQVLAQIAEAGGLGTGRHDLCGRNRE